MAQMTNNLAAYIWSIADLPTAGLSDEAQEKLILRATNGLPSII